MKAMLDFCLHTRVRSSSFSLARSTLVLEFLGRQARLRCGVPDHGYVDVLLTLASALVSGIDRHYLFATVQHHMRPHDVPNFAGRGDDSMQKSVACRRYCAPS